MRDSVLKNPFVFAALICLVCSFLLSLCAQALRPAQERQVRIDVHRNILNAVGITGEAGKKLSDDDVERLFEEKLRLLIIDPEGNIDTNTTPEQIERGEVTDRMEVYVMEENGEPKAYVVPMEGNGLWGPISGYVAFEPDCRTIRGVTFFAEKETPGLGAEITKPPFQDQFKGKHVMDENGNLLPLIVVKGKAAELVPDEIDHAVDGISGATLTSNGVQAMFAEWLERYKPFFDKVRKSKGGQV